MTNFKGTKGKWFIQNISYIKNWINISSDKGIIARTFFGEEEPIVDEKEAEANAKLIACAPEMLEDLIDITWLIENGATYGEIKERIIYTKQLIKKATE